MSENREYSDLSHLFADPERLMRQHAEQAERAQQLEEHMRTVRGTARSDDARIVVGYTEDNGVEELTLDPRALRLGSAELADTIRDLVNAARTDARTQAESMAAEAVGVSVPDPRAIVAEMPDLQSQLDELMRDTQQMGGAITSLVERMRASVGAPPTDQSSGS